MAEPLGLQVLNRMKFHGKSDDEIDTITAQIATKMRENNYSNQEIRDFFGVKDPDMDGAKKYVINNLNNTYQGDTPKEAKSFREAFEAGIQMSVSGLIARQELPDITLPQDPDMILRIASGVGSIVGDIPAMFAGGVAGAAVGGPLAPITAPAGGFAVPAGIRQLLIDRYEKGDIKSAGDFWERLSSVAIETIKGGAVGAVTGAAGKFIGLGTKSLGVTGKTAAATQISAEIGAMTTASAAVEGELPQPEHFVDAAILIGGFRGTMGIASKLRSLYRERGIKPGEAIDLFPQDPEIQNEILSEETIKPEQKALEIIEPPKSLQVLEDLPNERPTQIEVKKPEATLDVSETTKLFDETKPRDADDLAVLSRIGVQPKSDAKTIDFHKLYQNTIDDLHFLELAVKELKGDKGLDAAKDPYILARLYRNHSGIIDRFINKETISFESVKQKDVEITGESLKSILSKIDDMDGFRAFAMATHNLELIKKGQPNIGIDKDISLRVMKKHKRFAKNFIEIEQYMERVLQYGVDSGLLSKESMERMRTANMFYIPLFRVQDIDPLTGKMTNGKPNPFKGRKGSDKLIIDPIESFYGYTASIIKAAERNRVVRELVELQEKAPKENKLLESAKSESIKDNDLHSFLTGKGISDKDATAMVNDSLMFRRHGLFLKSNEFQVYRNGKREVWATKQDIADSINALDGTPGLVNVWQKLFVKGPAQLLRFGVTTTPDFIIKNFGRDSLTAFIQGKYNQIPVIDTVISMQHMFKKTKVWNDFLSSGGASQGFARMTDLINKEPWKLNQETGFINTSWNVVKTPFEMLQTGSALIENLPRFTEFRRGQGGAKAAFAAREVTLDFMRVGLKMRAFSAATAFMNVGIQGIDKTVRAIKENPTGILMKTGAAITLPSVMLWLANKDDSRYISAPQWQKDLYWLFPMDKWEEAVNIDQYDSMPDDLRKIENGKHMVNNGAVYRFPKPFEFGLLFGSLIETSLDSFYRKDPTAFKDFGETLFHAITPNVLPTVLTPLVEQSVNRNFFTDRPIIPYPLQKVSSDLQYQDYTSEMAKQLGKMIGYVPFLRDIGPEDARLSSPLVIDNYIRAWGGTLGQYALQIIDKGLTLKERQLTGFEEPVDTLADTPFIKSFVVRHPSFTSQPITDFYDNYSKNEKILNDVKKLIDEGEPEKAMERWGGTQEDFTKLNGIRQGMSNLNKFIRKIKFDKTMSGIEKRQLIDNAYYMMVQIAKEGNIIYKQAERK